MSSTGEKVSWDYTFCWFWCCLHYCCSLCIRRLCVASLGTMFLRCNLCNTNIVWYPIVRYPLYHVVFLHCSLCDENFVWFTDCWIPLLCDSIVRYTHCTPSMFMLQCYYVVIHAIPISCDISIVRYTYHMTVPWYFLRYHYRMIPIVRYLTTSLYRAIPHYHCNHVPTLKIMRYQNRVVPLSCDTCTMWPYRAILPLLPYRAISSLCVQYPHCVSLSCDSSLSVQPCSYVAVHAISILCDISIVPVLRDSIVRYPHCCCILSLLFWSSLSI
jgi:hypothetical protein